MIELMAMSRSARARSTGDKVHLETDDRVKRANAPELDEWWQHVKECPQCLKFNITCPAGEKLFLTLKNLPQRMAGTDTEPQL